MTDFIQPNAVVWREGEGEEHKSQGYWFFKDNMCVKTNDDGTVVLAGPYKITHREAWPILDTDEEFAEGGFDAVARHAAGARGYWFFKDGRCCKTNDRGDEWIHKPAPVTAEGNWPVLGNY